MGEIQKAKEQKSKIVEETKAVFKFGHKDRGKWQAILANAVLVVDAASADEFRTTVLAQRFVVFRTSVLEGRATQQRCYPSSRERNSCKKINCREIPKDNAAR